ncbi:unnamed protein product [Sphagnum balticum]
MVTQFITTTPKLTTTTSPLENLDLFVMANGYVEGSAPPGVRIYHTGPYGNVGSVHFIDLDETSRYIRIVLPYRTAYTYNTGTDHWQLLPPLNSVGHYHSSVSGYATSGRNGTHTQAFLNGRVYICGGCGCDRNRSCEWWQDGATKWRNQPEIDLGLLTVKNNRLLWLDASGSMYELASPGVSDQWRPFASQWMSQFHVVDSGDNTLPQDLTPRAIVGS